MRVEGPQSMPEAAPAAVEAIASTAAPADAAAGLPHVA